MKLAVLAIPIALLLCFAPWVYAEDGPKGPAELIGGAQRARSARELSQAGQRGESTEPHATDHGAERKPIASADLDGTLPAGVIHVRVVDQAGTPVPSAEVSLGIMASDSTRSSRAARTAADGTASFSKLAVGDKQAYRVNVPYQGAKYSSSPFRLPDSGGYRVEVRRLPVTHDERMVVLYVGATSIELKDERLKVVQQARLFNLGGTTYVFPRGGKLVKLPAGFMAMQSQDVMGDQRIVEKKVEGLLVQGSLPPGEVTLLWGFDLPLQGTEARFSLDIPWLTFAYRVIADAPPGMTLAVSGMPEPVTHADAGRKFLVTELQRKVGDAPFQRLDIVLQGIPGPGPERFIAAFLALCAIAAGIVLARNPHRRSASQATRDTSAQQAALLARARILAAQHRAQDIGPTFYAEQKSTLIDDLASLLIEEERQKAPPSAPA